MHVSSLPPRRPPQRILLVEDQLLIALDMTDQLEAGGYAVVGPASTVETAVALIGKEPLDAAVLDVNLGDATSFPVAEALRQQDTPFVFATGRRRTDLEPEFQDCVVLAKPVQEEQLLGCLARLLDES